MIRALNKTDYNRLVDIWESSVLNTHDFLKEEDFNYYKENIPNYFSHVNLIGYEFEGILVGFLGYAEENLEMLFIHNDFRRKGIGKQLLDFALCNYKITNVEVNEQNIQAINFYKKEGFEVFNRTETDEAGKNYPLLQMTFKKY